MQLAREIVSLYYGKEEANQAEEYFKTVYQKKDIPDDIPEMTIDEIDAENIVKLMAKSKLAPSSSEARRLIDQGAVKINGEKIKSFKGVKLNNEDIIQVGKSKFLKVLI